MNSRWIFVFSVLVSIVIHFLVLGLLFSQPEKTTVIDLSCLQPEEKLVPQSTSPEVSEKCFRVQVLDKERMPTGKAYPGKKFFRVEQEKRALRRVLDAVKSSIMPYWRSARPPGSGRISLELAIDSQGRTIVRNSRTLKDSRLGRYICNMVLKAAPFREAMQKRSRPVEIECVFFVGKWSSVIEGNN